VTSADIEFLSEGEGPPVICLHGIGGSAQSFRHQLDGLRDYRIIAWNMPGYGKSPKKPLSFPLLSEMLGNFIQNLDLEKVHLLGHSIGGMLAIEHAIRRPGQVKSLALIGTTSSFGGRDDSFKQAFLKARLSPLEAGLTMGEIAKLAIPKLVGPIADPSCISAIETEMAKISETTWRNVLECLVTFDRRNDLAEIPVPTCLIAGSEDQNAPARTMRKMAEALPKGSYHEIEGARHMIHQEAPADVNVILRSFYEGLAP